MKLSLALLSVSPVLAVVPSVQLGPRPFWLIDQMDDSPLKDRLSACAASKSEYVVSDFSIGHRGACMQFPEHTLESYHAALVMGAGIVECDVTFTKDLELVCRHAQCDLHTTTNVVTIPEMNAKCSTPWAPGVAPSCCASDFTLAELKTLCAKMDSSNPDGATAEEYAYGGTADWRTDLYQQESCPEIPTHMESIELIGASDGYFTPELKSPSVEMPFMGTYTQEMYAQQMIDEYVAAGVPPSQVWPQSFNPSDVFYWIENTEFGDQAVALDGNYDFTEAEIDTHLDMLVAGGAKIVAPPMQRLVAPAPDSPYKMMASYYANAAMERGLDIITWTLERSGPGLSGFYWGTTDGLVDLNEGDRYNILYVLSMEVGILGIFSDWPATTTFFGNCMNLALRSSPSVSEKTGGCTTCMGSIPSRIAVIVTFDEADIIPAPFTPGNGLNTAGEFGFAGEMWPAKTDVRQVKDPTFVIGYVSELCVKSDDDEAWRCTGTIRFDRYDGYLSYDGVYANGETGGIYPIVGGTEDFAGAAGIVTTVFDEATGESLQVFDFY